MHKVALGLFGQNIAKDHLQKKSYKILTSNFRTRFAEIDLIVEKDNVLVFVEVKTRHSEKLGLPEEAVTPRKLHSIETAAMIFKEENPKTPDQMRIDVIAIVLDEDGKIRRLDHLENVTG